MPGLSKRLIRNGETSNKVRVVIVMIRGMKEFRKTYRESTELKEKKTLFWQLQGLIRLEYPSLSSSINAFMKNCAFEPDKYAKYL